jgi:hypothetical protein
MLKHWVRLGWYFLRFAFTRNPVKTDMLLVLCSTPETVFTADRKLSLSWEEKSGKCRIGYAPGVPGECLSESIHDPVSGLIVSRF